MAEASTAERDVAVVTGAAGGLGAAIVRRLLERGLRVGALDRSRAQLEAALGEERAELRFVEVDVVLPESLHAAASVTADALGPATVLVNCAGVFARTPALRASTETVDRVIDVNLKGALHATHAFVPQMARRRRGRIVNVASIAAATGAALASAYAASKAGLVAVTRSHARELAGAGVAVNAVLPGFCRTPMSEPEAATLARFVVPRIPVGRLAEPDEIAEVVEFLATCRSAYLTGAVVTIDGGLHVG
jgi:3-oxoacyl-[acyl-carrier protein] reductase